MTLLDHQERYKAADAVFRANHKWHNGSSTIEALMNALGTLEALQAQYDAWHAKVCKNETPSSL